MAMPKVLDWLDDLVAQVATNVTNIAKNASDIAANKEIFDTHAADDNRHWTETDRQNFDRTIHFKGYFVSLDKLKEAYPTGQLGDYAIVGGTDTVWLWDDETNTWLNSTEQGIVISVNGRTGEVILTKTDVGLSNVDNTSDINKPVSNAQKTALSYKADRRKITLAESESLDLRSGIYFVTDEAKTILGVTSNYWTVIIGEQEASSKSATQIWMNYGTGQVPHMFFRHQVSQTSWTEFSEILNSNHLATLNNTISELNSNVQTNATDIDTLEGNKANRGNITLEQAQSKNLLAGIYSVCETVTILGHTEKFWQVIVGEYNNTTNNNNRYVTTQIWIPFEYAQAGKGIKMYVRRAVNNENGVSGWSRFVEVITTDHLTLEDVSRAKQYKGFYSDLLSLVSEYPSATDGDYAIVGDTLFIWNSINASWTEVSGSGGGGSTGTGKWSIKKYEALEYTEAIVPKLEMLATKSPYTQWEVDDTEGEILYDNEGDGNLYLIETCVNIAQNTMMTVPLAPMIFNWGINVYVNGESIFSTEYGSLDYTETIDATMEFHEGWNKVQIVLFELRETAQFELGTKITNNYGICLDIDCYHNYDTVVQGAYVPLIGDSTIEGNVTVNGTLNVTENSYLQYNETDNSISFMFNN